MTVTELDLVSQILIEIIPSHFIQKRTCGVFQKLGVICKLYSNC